MSAFDPKRTSPDRCPLSVWDYLRSAQVGANDMRVVFPLRMFTLQLCPFGQYRNFRPSLNFKERGCIRFPRWRVGRDGTMIQVSTGTLAERYAQGKRLRKKTAREKHAE